MKNYRIPVKLEATAKWGIIDINKRAWLFKYRSMGQDLKVQLEGSSLNDVLVLFASHYNMVDEIYEIKEETNCRCCGGSKNDDGKCIDLNCSVHNI